MQDGEPGEINGVLTLFVYDSGIVKGDYHVVGSVGSDVVSGGLKGKAIWLDVTGTDHDSPLHLTGSFEDGKLEATASMVGAADAPGVRAYKSGQLGSTDHSPDNRGQLRRFVSAKSTLLDS